jgi:heme-degrading monooxygenase HmoA
MILEVAVLDVIPGQESEFELAFEQASPLIASMSGYLEHSLRRCLEKSSRYLLLVRWETLEDHTRGFRFSSEYQEWKRLLHHFYDPFPTVEHFSPPLVGPDSVD